jgi:hypothetical protein
MGKKKGKRKKHIYTKAEFLDIICTRCGLCKELGNPLFCYDNMYRLSKKVFIKKALPRLLEVSSWQKQSGLPYHSRNNVDFEYAFKRIFCLSGVCGSKEANCENLLGCMMIFRNQLSNTNVSNKIKINIKKKNKKAWHPRPYPTFFTNDNDEWKEEIRRIVNENDNSEQDFVATDSAKSKEITNTLFTSA